MNELPAIVINIAPQVSIPMFIIGGFLVGRRKRKRHPWGLSVSLRVRRA